MEQTLDFFDIQNGSQLRENFENESNTGPDSVAKEQLISDLLCDDIELLENEIKCETISIDEDQTTAEEVSTSCTYSSEAEAIQSNNYERIKYRPSLDSCFSADQRSTCSPTTSNQPMASPMKNLSLIVSTETNLPIKQEFNEIIFDEQCIGKLNDVPSTMEDVTTMDLNLGAKTELRRPFNFDRPVSLNETLSCKRQSSQDLIENFKRQKLTNGNFLLFFFPPIFRKRYKGAKKLN